MSLINGLAAFGTGLGAFAGDAATDAAMPMRTPLMSTPAAEAPAPVTPEKPATSYGEASLLGPRMPAGPNPYGAGPNAQALWAAELAIKGPESGGKADAQNPVSSAGGLFQITNSTWDAALKKMGLPLAASDADRNAQKYQPDLNTAVMRDINSEAAATLDKAGLPVTVQTLQAAHRLGPAGAVTAIKAAMSDPSTPLIGNGLPSESIRGNGDISHLSVGAFLQAPYPNSRGGS